MQQTNNGEILTPTERKLRNLRPFKPGPDPRRHKGGRPKSFDHFRELAQSIASREKAIEILKRWADSPEPQLQRAFVEYAFGKVPDKIETTGLENKTTLVLHFDHERGVTK